MQKIKLNLTPGKVAPVCYASQGDVGLAIRFILFDGETALTLSGTEVITLAIKKADGSELEESVTNTGSNYVDVITTADTCDTPGASLCELRFQDGGDDLGTGNFIMEVEADAYAGANIEERTASGTIANFETNLQDNLTACKCEINALQSGSGTPSPNNPRPISGFNGATIVRCGVNFAKVDNDENPQKSYYTYSTETPEKIYGTKNHASNMYFYVFEAYVSSGTTYLFHYGKYQINGANSNCSIYLYSDNILGTSLGNFLVPDTGYTWTSNYTGRILIGIYGIGGNGSTFEIDEFMLSDTATDYSPYNGQTATVNFGQTVYGGVLDVTNGKVTIERVAVDLGTLTWTKQTSVGGTKTYFRTASEIADCKKNTNVGQLQGLICSNYAEDTWSHTVDTVGYDSTICTGWTNKSYIAINDQSKVSMSADDFKTAMSGVQLVYPLATPTEITLTPKQIETIVGINNVYHDCNGETEVKYLVEV